MSASDQRQRHSGGPLTGISEEAILRSAPVLNGANDNQQQAQLKPASEDEGTVTGVQSESRRPRGVVLVLACTTTALACAAAWLYIVSIALVDNVASLVK